MPLFSRILDPRGHGPRRRTLALATGLALAANLTVLAVAPAVARDSLCDAPVTANMRLADDLDCTGGDGLVIDGQSGITIDLNFHTIQGQASYAGITIVNSKRIKVINGAIKGFSTQIDVDASSSVTLDNLVLRNIRNGGTGVAVSGSSGVTANNVVAVDSLGSAYAGFYVTANAGKLTISNSSTKGFGESVSVTGSTSGSAVTIANTIISENRGDGLYYYENVGTLTVKNSTIVDSNYGFYISCDDDTPGPHGPITLTGNRALRNDGLGFAIEHCPSGKSTISGNVSADNSGTGFYGDDVPNATWSNNRSSANGSSGFEITRADGSTFKGNRADLNEVAGIYVSDNGVVPPAAITDNFARGNGADGFVVGLGDLTGLSSGNVAFGNGADDCDVSLTCVGHADVPSTASLTCGDPVSASIVLSQSLNCSTTAGPALTIASGASRITIDLNGYTLKVKDIGIKLLGPGPTKSITIKNGYIDGASGGGAGRGVYVSADGSTVLLENLLSDGDGGMLETEEGVTEGVTATANDVVYNGAFGDYVLYGYSDTTAAALPNTMKMFNSVTGPHASGPYANIVQVDRSVIIDGGVSGEDGSLLTNSVAMGYYAASLYCVLDGTVSLSGNLLLGTAATGSWGASIRNCGGGTIASNTAVGAGFNGGAGFYADTSDGMKWTGNRAFANHNGFLLIFDGNSAVLKGNTADGNTSDGFYLMGIGAGKVFSGNVARGNGYIGFESVTTAMNGSGNIGFGNGTDNCVQVTCKLPA